MYKPLRAAWLSAALTLASHTASGENLYQGMKGPGSAQLDLRVTAATHGEKTELTQRNILKVWPTAHAFWAYLNIAATSRDGSSGLNDIRVGAGPRVLCQDHNATLGVLPYLGVTLPVGARGFSTDRTDFEGGINATYLRLPWQADVLASYTLTGRNARGINPVNSVFAGVLLARQLSSRSWLGVGGTVADAGTTTTAVHATARYGTSRAHVEGVARYSPATKTRTLEGRVRINI